MATGPTSLDWDDMSKMPTFRSMCELSCRGGQHRDDNSPSSESYGTMIDKAVLDTVSANQVGLVLRVRSDSALIAMKKAAAVAAGGAEAQVAVSPHESQVSHPRSQSHRMSLGAVALGPKFDLNHKRCDGFFDVFGILGVPMVICFLSGSLAVLTQAYIQVYPTKFANYLMNTTTYDSGEFWMLPDPEPAPTTVATTLLIALAACYLYFAVLMVFFHHHAVPKTKTSDSVKSAVNSTNTIWDRDSLASRREGLTNSIPSRHRLPIQFPEMNSSQLVRLLVPALLWPAKDTRAVLTVHDGTGSPGDKNGKNVVPVTGDRTIMKDSLRLQVSTAIPVREIYKQFVNPNGVYHAYYNVLYDAPKLIFQTITLLAYLRKGFPIPLTAFYASLLTVNYLISFYRFQRKQIDRNLIITRLFYLLDIFFAAFAPIVVLAYAYYNFHFDRDVFATKVETLSPGIFDRIARLYADPVEISVFRLAFGSLRLTTPSTIFTKCSLLLLSIIKWRKIITYLIQMNHAKQCQLPDQHPKVLKHSSSRRHLLFGMGVFIFFGIGVVVYTAGSISTSSRHCGQHKHCVVISYHWLFSDESCPCLVYINRKSDPRTFAEWVNPPDATEELSAVAKMGELKVIQIVNRKLPSLPDSLRSCKKLERLILLYTKTEVIPEWTEELHYLQYFHIEGDFTSSLTTFPPNTFKHMKKLTYLHTGIVPKLTEYPSLDGLVKLQTLAIAAPHSLKELPSFDKLTNLRVLLLVEQASVRRLPSLQHLKSIKQIAVFYRASMCCNGYLTPGKCDLTDYQCLPRANEPPVQCSNESISDVDTALLQRIGATMCPDWMSDLRDAAPSRESTDIACGGVLFRQCQMGNATGMCYNGRMQVVYCDTVGELEKMRRLQIQRRVGIPCDPTVERWLGCEEAW